MRKETVRSKAWGSKLLAAAFLMMTCSFTGITAYCQVLYGTINGTVTDSTGAAVSGATVTATQTETNTSRTGTTNESGFYMLATLPPGTFRIAITRAGFSDFKTQDFAVKTNSVARIDAILTVGSTKETVTVSAETVQLQTDRTDVNTLLPSEDLQNLPQPTRSYEGLLGNVAGVGSLSVVGLGTNNPDKSFGIEANGTSMSATDVRIEGVPNADIWVPYLSALVPSVEAIETVSMVTGSAEAEQTLASGATINVQLKSGSNHFHGSAYEYHIDNLAGARPYFLNPSAKMPGKLDNDFGGTLGGPILRNKLFFFGSYEGDFNRSGYLTTQTVPTAAMLSGDFTATNTTIYDSNTGNPDGTGKVSFLAETGQNAIPANRISTNVKPLLALLSKITPTNSGYSNNFQGVVANPATLHRIDTKFDWKTTDKLSLMGRYNYHPYSVLQIQPFNPSGVLNIATPTSSGHTYGVSIAATYVATSHLVINGSWGIMRTVQALTPFNNTVKYGASVLGIPGTNIGDLPAGGGMPRFNISGYSGLGYNWTYLQYNDPIVNYDGSATWNKGSHTIKFGTDIHSEHMNHIETTPDKLGFTGGSTTLKGGSTANQFNGFADFLLGNPNSWSNSYQPFKESRLITHQFSLYGMDTWQVNRKLTVNVGTGWAYLPVPTHGSYGLENYVIATNTYEVCGYGGIAQNCGIDSGKGLWSPNLGFAYRPFNGFVVRAGASVGAEQFNIGRDAIYNYPENLGYSASAPNPYVAVGSLSSGVPVLPAPDYKAGIIPFAAGASFTSIPKSLAHGYVESFNLTVQKQFGAWLAQVGFVGNSSIHQHMRYNINYGTVGGGTTSQQLYLALNHTSAAETEIRPLGHTHYDSLQATLDRRFANGFQLKSTYTYSKWIGLCCDNTGFGALMTPIPEYQRLNYAPINADQRHVFNLSGIAKSPFGKGKKFLQNGPGSFVLGGWQLGAVATVHSGTPFSIGADGASLNAPGSTQRADQVKTHVAINGGTKQYFDITAYKPVTAVRFGTSGYDSVYGPGSANLDASIFRSFELPEHLTAQFRLESLNLTNTPHFGNPGSNVSSVQYDSNGNIVNANGFGQITGTSAVNRSEDERYFRIGLKIMF